MRSFVLIIFFIPTLFISGKIRSQDNGKKTFTNPLLPSGADPYSFYKDGYYYYTNTLGNRIGLWKTKSLADLKNAIHKTIYEPPEGTMYSKQLWAPEIMFIGGKWYAYFAADDGNNNNHRMYVLENGSPDPMNGEWVFKGKIADPSDKWAIDGDVFEYKGQWYMIWSGWEGDTNGQQNIYIAKLENPWTIDGDRVCISRPTYQWETHGDLHDANNPAHVNVNEGPQALQYDGNLFIVYSASGCWTDYYALGLLRFAGGDDLLSAQSWKKSAAPVFEKSEKNAVYAPGHNSFFKSPDGKEDWILYHANDLPGQGCGGHRSPRMQKIIWKSDGSPYFGEPVKKGTLLSLPSGME
jgi:GH43 family beta-xylosidase